MNTNRSKLSIANKALFKIGAERISAFNSNTPNSVIIQEIYDDCRQEVIEEMPWSFCINTLTLSTLAATLIEFNDGINIAYGIPADFMSLYLVNQPGCLYRIEQLKSPIVPATIMAFLSDTPNLIIKYIADNDDPTTYSAKFTDALACKLALGCCFKISEAATLKQGIEAEYQRALLSAMAADSKNQIPDELIANEWFIARLAGSGAVSGLPNGNIGFFPNPYNPDF